MNKCICTIFCVIIVMLVVSCSRQEATLTFMVGGAPEEIIHWEKLIQEFETDTNINVRLIRQPTDSDLRRQGLVVPLKSQQNNPDVFLMDVVWIGQFVASDWLEPLDNYISMDRFSLEPFFARVIDFADKYDKKLYALPVYVDGGLLYYRKDLLANYNVEAPPITWNELVQYSLKIQQHERETNPNFYGFVWQGAQYEGLVCTFLEFAASNGATLVDNEGVFRLNTVKSTEALRFMRDIIYDHRISPYNTFTEMKEEEVRRFFQQGNAVFERNWPYAWALHEADDSPIKGNVGIAPLPHFPDGRSVSTLGGWHVGISKYSDKKDQAWELVKFITSFDTEKNLALNLGWNPGRKDVYEDEDVISRLPHLPILKVILEQVVARPNLPYYTQLSQIMQLYINACLSGKIRPKPALDKAQKDIEKIRQMYERE